MSLSIAIGMGLGRGGKASVSPPANTVAPAISGTQNIGYTLTAIPGTYTNNPTSRSYQWKRAGVNIGGATNSTYVLTETDSGAAITVTETATNAGGSASASSASVTPPSFLLLDRMTTSRAAGSVNGTAMEPGGSLARNRTIVDGSSIAPIANGQWAIGLGGGANDPNYVMSGAGIARADGLTLIVKCNTGNSSSFLVGWGINPTAYTHDANWNNGNLRMGNGGFANIAVQLHNSPYWYIIVLRSTGVFVFVFGADFAYPSLLFIERAGTSTPLFPAWHRSTANGGNMNVDDVAVPTAALVPTAIASDNYAGSLGTTNSYYGGTAKTYTDRLGTSAISAGALAFSALSSSEGLTTIDAGVADVVVIASLTRSAGVVGIVTRWTDASNYVRIVHDGTALKIVKRVGGTETQVLSLNITYSASADLVVVWNRTNIRAFYNGTPIASGDTAITDAGVQSGTNVGFYSSDTGNTFDNFAVFGRGNSNEHSQYRSYGVLKQTQKMIVFEGDSLTVGTTGTTNSYPYVAISSLGRSDYDYYNVAVTGQTAASMLTDASYQYQALIGPWAKHILVILAGSNDLSVGDSAATVYNRIVSLSSDWRAAGGQSIIITIPARGTLSAGQNTARQTVNSSILTNAATICDGVVDAAATFTNASDTSLYNADTVHFTTLGYSTLAGLVVTAIQALP